MASSSQDHYIRVWRLETLDKESMHTIAQEEKEEDENLDQYRSRKSYLLMLEEVYRFSMESVLSGHQDVVASVQWGKEKATGELPLLLSSSFDYTVAVWRYSMEDKSWGIVTRLGEVVGNKNAYFGASMSEDARSVLAYTFNGSFHLWEEDAD